MTRTADTNRSRRSSPHAQGGVQVLSSFVRLVLRWRYLILISIALIYLFTLAILTNRQNQAIGAEEVIESYGGMLLRSSKEKSKSKGMTLFDSQQGKAKETRLPIQPPASRSGGGNATKCTFCEVLIKPDLVVPHTGGKTCGLIKLMANGEVNESDLCAIIQEKKRVCCPTHQDTVLPWEKNQNRPYSPPTTIFVISLQGTPGTHESNNRRLDLFKEKWRNACGSSSASNTYIEQCPTPFDTRRGYGVTQAWILCLWRARQLDEDVVIFLEDDARLFENSTGVFCDVKRRGELLSKLPSDTFLAFLGGHTWSYEDSAVPYRRVHNSYGAYGFVVPRESIDDFHAALSHGLIHGSKDRKQNVHHNFLDPEPNFYRAAREYRKRIYAFNPLVVWHEGGYSNTWGKVRGNITGLETQKQGIKVSSGMSNENTSKRSMTKINVNDGADFSSKLKTTKSAAQQQESKRLQPSSASGGADTRCTFCEGGEGIPNPNILVPGTGGNTCGSIKLMAAGEVNGNDVCATIQKEERVCCPDTNKSAAGSKEEGGALVEVSRVGTHEVENSSLPATIVTAYFKITSKHTHTEYNQWMENTMSLNDPMVIYTSPDLVPAMKRLRSHALERTKVIPMELHEMRMPTQYGIQPFWEIQHAMDPEKTINKSYHLYWIWNEKLEFLRRTIAENPFQSNFFAWVDIGYFRTPKYNHRVMLQQIPTALEQDQILGLDVRGFGGKGNHMGGGFIGGYTAGILRFHSIFYALLEAHKHEFIGVDQQWFKRGCIENEGLCVLVKPDKDHGDPWFFMAPYMMGMINSGDGDGSIVKFCGSNKWLGARNMTCKERTQILVRRYQMSEQNAKSSLLESGCQCKAQQESKSNRGVSRLQPLASRNEGICTFCKGKGGILNLDLVVPGTGGNTCGSIKSMAAGEVNGSDVCATIQKEERVCCPVLYDKASSSLNTDRNQQSADFDRFNEGDLVTYLIRNEPHLAQIVGIVRKKKAFTLKYFKPITDMGLEETVAYRPGILQSNSEALLARTGTFSNCTRNMENSNSIFGEANDRNATVSCRTIRFSAEASSFVGKSGAIIVGVLSTSNNLSWRESIRTTWAAKNTTVFFVLAGSWNDIKEEYNMYKDIIWIDMEESFRLITFKTSMFFQVVNMMAFELNLSYSHVLKTDDDSYVALGRLEKFVKKEQPKHLDYWGHSDMKYVKPLRNPKNRYFESLEQYPEPYYPPFVNGAAILLSRKTVECVTRTMRDARFLDLEDVFIGIAVARCGAIPTHSDLVRVYRNSIKVSRWRTTENNMQEVTMNNKIIQHRILSPEEMIAHHESMKTNKFQFDAIHIQKEKSVCCQEIVKHLAKGGRLGNQLFEHAATLAIAKATRKQACVIGRNVDLIDKYFTVDGVFLRNCANTTPSQSASETGYAMFSPLPKAERSLEIFGFFQSWKYFAGAEAEAEIMQAFTLKPKYLRYADEILGKGGEDSYYNVGIHMRWFEFDYLIDPPKEYYQSAMGYFRRTYGQKNKRVRFYLASSDIERSKKLGLFSDESVVILNNQEAIIDFAVLLSCEGMILSSGSFGWWAAWLGPHQRNGEVFYFSDVFDMNDSINKGHVQKGDYYPPNWKEIAPEDLSS